jgi:hypothetical protein
MSIISEPVQLIITERDIQEYGGFQLAKELLGADQPAMLGKKATEVVDDLMSILPRIITEKIQKIIPSGYSIAEIVLNMKVRGSFAIVGIDGEVQIKLKPKV